MLPSGDIEFIGRTDEQVKYHGYRVELNEIRSALNKHPRVKESVIVKKRNRKGEEVLIGYYVSRQEISAGQLRTWLAESVIEETIPTIFVHLKKLPLTMNGKVNYEGLPSVEEAIEKQRKSYVGASTEAEKKVAAIWGEVLGVEEVGIYDNFFDLGGHSLIGTRVISRLRETFKVEIPLQTLFEHPTLVDLAEQVDIALSKAQIRQIPPIIPVPRDIELPLSFAQHRLWFLNQLEPDIAFYNVASSARLAGPLKVRALCDAFNEMVNRHEVLRTTFAVINGQPLQIIAPFTPIDMEAIDLSPLSEDDAQNRAYQIAAEEAQKPFDLAQGPLLRTKLLRLAEYDHVMSITMHHIVADGWSLGIFIRELAELYRSFATGDDCQLESLPIQYADFACWQRKWLKGTVLENQLSYWKQQLAGAPAFLDLPTDRPRPSFQSYHGATLVFSLPKALAKSLKSVSQQEGTTLFMTLLAGYYSMLHYYAKQEDIVVGTDVANRSSLETEKLIGFFVNMLALRVNLSGDPTFRELLERVRKVTLGAYANQDLPFDKLVEELKAERDLSRTPLFQTVLVFQNLPSEPIHMPDGLTITPLNFETSTAKFDLLLTLREDENVIQGCFEYNVDLFDAATISRMAVSLETILNQVAEHNDARLSEIKEKLAEAEAEINLARQKEFKNASLKRRQNLKMKLSADT